VTTELLYSRVSYYRRDVGRLDVLEEASALLGANSVFSVLSPAKREQLLRYGSKLSLAKGVRLCSRGDPGDACFLVLSGEIEVMVTDADGRDVWLAALGPGALIGEIAVLDGGPRSADMTAMRRSTLLSIRREAIFATLREEPDSALALLSLLATRLRYTDARVEETALIDLPGRLARVLLQGGAAPITQSQTELARQIGASRERVNKALAKWREEDWITIGASGIRVLNRAALARLTKGSKRS
jgi:CRP/FNR family cyclic AMP-dependent transcriptional regulator